MRVPPSVDGPYFPPSEFLDLGDALDYASMMSHDISCAGEMGLYHIEDPDNDPMYWVSCSICGDSDSVTPVVYYRYKARWGATPTC